MQYLSFLNAILSLGPKLQVLWPLILELFAVIEKIGEAIKPAGEPGELSFSAPLSPDELNAEAAIGQMVADAGTLAAFDGSRLRKVYAVLKQLFGL